MQSFTSLNVLNLIKPYAIRELCQSSNMAFTYTFHKINALTNEVCHVIVQISLNVSQEKGEAWKFKRKKRELKKKEEVKKRVKKKMKKKKSMPSIQAREFESITP